MFDFLRFQTHSPLRVPEHKGMMLSLPAATDAPNSVTVKLPLMISVKNDVKVCYVHM